MMDFNKFNVDVIKNNEIKEVHLKRMPALKTCDNWKEVQEVGLIDHKTRLMHYKGAIVKLKNNYYFVASERIDAVGVYRGWNFSTTLKVI